MGVNNIIVERVFDTRQNSNHRRLRGYVVAVKTEDGKVMFGYSQYNKSRENRPFSRKFGKDCAYDRAVSGRLITIDELPYNVSKAFPKFMRRCTKYFRDGEVFANVESREMPELRAGSGGLRMKIFLDDVRNPPSNDWTTCRTAEEAIELIKAGKCEGISFDHYLGDGLTGVDVARTFERMAAEGTLKRFPKWTVHSANPIERDNIVRTMESAWRLYSEAVR